MAARLPGTVASVAKEYSTDQIPTTYTFTASIISSFHRAQTHVEIYSQTHMNQSLSKGTI